MLNDDYNPYLEDRDADLYDEWRDKCCLEFDDDLNELINKYLKKEQHYMNNKKHLIEALKSTIYFLEKSNKKRI